MPPNSSENTKLQHEGQTLPEGCHSICFKHHPFITPTAFRRKRIQGPEPCLYPHLEAPQQPQQDPLDKSQGIQQPQHWWVQGAKASKLQLPVMHGMLSTPQNPSKAGRATDPCRNNRIYKKPTHQQPNRWGPSRGATPHPLFPSRRVRKDRESSKHLIISPWSLCRQLHQVFSSPGPGHPERQQAASSTKSFGEGIFTFRASGVSSKQ